MEVTAMPAVDVLRRPLSYLTRLSLLASCSAAKREVRRRDWHAATHWRTHMHITIPLQPCDDQGPTRVDCFRGLPPKSQPATPGDWPDSATWLELPLKDLEVMLSKPRPITTLTSQRSTHRS